MAVFRVFIEKKQPYAVEAQGVLDDLHAALGLESLKVVRILNRYDAEHITPEDFAAARMTVFGEPQVDVAHDTLPAAAGRVFAVEYLPGQYDQRADSAAQCIQLQTQKHRPIIRCARVYILEGNLSDEEFATVRQYLINPVESREASLAKPDTLETDYPTPPDVAVLTGFCRASNEELAQMVAQYGLAMELDDLQCCRDYFISEQRDPTFTELKLIDTYWSDHCRHTTFSTQFDHISFESDTVKNAFKRYLDLRISLGRADRPITLMDLATIGAKALKKRGLLNDLDESEEINACSVKIKVDVDGQDEDWLLMFKNETHNHPTEIEPFGGAATCLGGAIRDPLSGRSYVYQAMRVTGAANPLKPISETMPGKLPQRKIVTQAAAGYSSYGNQIGLATGLVHEVYHPGYVAKRMEVGAVIAAAPAQNVVRTTPEPGDIVLLLGGKTGRDGCGGATGSSKAHSSESLLTCGAEVQKGNAPEERKLQRLFRNPEAAKMIKRCNDFGAGGVSVAIGELADSLDISLDAVPKKYEGLDGTELAISESQERMAVVLDAENVTRFLEIAKTENLSGVTVATVTDTGRMTMSWRGKIIVNLSRAFLNTNGAQKHVCARVAAPAAEVPTAEYLSFAERLRRMATDLNVCSQKGLAERFDASIGAGTVLFPFGGKYQETPIQTMAAKIPVLHGVTDTTSLMAYAFDPYISKRHPYAGAVTAVCESIAKVVAAGGSRKRCWLSFQEYFERLRHDDIRWGKPLAALLGALDAQIALECGAIGGKDSMSGSFEHIDVPSTLISFAVSVSKASRVISPEFKKSGSTIGLMLPAVDSHGVPDLNSVRQMLDEIEVLIAAGKIRAAWVCGMGGVMEGLFKMALGNRIGVKLCDGFSDDFWFNRQPSAIIVECDDIPAGAVKIGETSAAFLLSCSYGNLDLGEIFSLYSDKLAPVYPYRLTTPATALPTFADKHADTRCAPAIKVANPRVLLPVFAGTNCEYDTARAFERAGAVTETFIVQNRSAADIEYSAREFERLIRECNILAVPGGFSGGDEPDGSGKFITAFFRNPRIGEAVTDLLDNRDGLMIGICNGFQALVKLGLVPFGKIIAPDENAPTLTFNRIGRHQSKLVTTRVCSNRSPWMMYNAVGDLHVVPVSHGEGRFVASPELIAQLAVNGQIATQYVNLSGVPTLDTEFNPNFSDCAIEGITSPDGRIFAKMGHSERIGENIHKNVPGAKDQKLFLGAVHYFTK
ncbi:MAG TPA: phosphoribosylformylglycinamidine synthase [Clostridia bacterium]|nr:phosphoribosylformylglycinamidine synthase [Clostridia bacterium]